MQPAPGTRREFTPLEGHYRIDINTIPPAVEERTWRLKVNGLVEKPLSLTLEELRRYEPLHQFITLSCISNPVGGDLIGTTRWSGVSFNRILPNLKLQPAATHLKIRSADDFYEVVALEAIRADPRIMLAYDWDGVPLTRDHGFPLRIYIPNVHGMKQPKWIESIEATDHWEPGYWVKRGWDKEARMKATSVIDTVAVDMTIVAADQKKRVPIGGIAHAGVRGISKVEVRVDNGPWKSAALRAPLSDLTWVIWRYDWPFRPGKHTFTVRCFDGNGTPQIETQAPPEPSGASGLHSKRRCFDPASPTSEATSCNSCYCFLFLPPVFAESPVALATAVVLPDVFQPTMAFAFKSCTSCCNSGFFARFTSSPGSARMS